MAEIMTDKELNELFALLDEGQHYFLHHLEECFNEATDSDL